MKQNAKTAGFPFNKSIFALGAAIFLITAGQAGAAEIGIPDLEMDTWGRVENGEFVLSTFFSADIALTEGGKYAFLLGFSLDAGDIVNKGAFPGFRVARATAKDVFGLPLDFSYFFGESDNFCTGDDFPVLFGTSPFGTAFRGFFYFPRGIGGNPERRYRGIYGVRGTGINLTLKKWDILVPTLYIYQDFADSTIFLDPPQPPGSGKALYSGDLRLLFCYSWLRIETFGGVSIDAEFNRSIRGGLMAHFAGNDVEFFIQGGVPGFTWGEEFSIDNVFFLIEPRLRLGNFGVNMSFFYHPVEYIHVRTGEERGMADLNIKFLVGNPDSGISGGIETGGELKIDDLSYYQLYVSPFAALIYGGLRWDLRIRIKPLEYKNPQKMAEIFLGVRTAF
jgi:hypothetical protein